MNPEEGPSLEDARILAAERQHRTIMNARGRLLTLRHELLRQAGRE